MSGSELLNIAGLACIALSNVYIGLQVRSQKTENNITLPELKPVIQIELDPAPVTILAEPSDLSFDYEGFGAAIKKALVEAQVALQNAQVEQQPVLAPVLPSPGTAIPASVSAPLRSNVVEINGVPARQFPVS